MRFISWLFRLLGLSKPAPKPLATECEPTAAELVETLEAIIEVLRADGDSHWTAWMERSRLDLEQRDYRGVEHLLNAYGGMGSFNDLVIGQRTHGESFAWAENAASANDTLDALRSRAYGLACTLKQLHHGAQ